MTDANTLQDLKDRLDKADGPDRELDADLALLGGWTEFPGDNWIGPFGEICVPNYTASTDAALGLIERVLPGWRVDFIQQSLDEPYWTSGLYKRVADTHQIDRASGSAPTAPLALLRALMAALEQAKAAE